MFEGLRGGFFFLSSSSATSVPKPCFLVLSNREVADRIPGAGEELRGYNIARTVNATSGTGALCRRGWWGVVVRFGS